MWHKIIMPLAIAALLVGGSAHGALERIEEAYEVELLRVELPTHEAGQVLFVPCIECDRVALPVTAATRYQLVGEENGMPLKAFRELAASVNNPRDALVYVIYSTANREVKRLVLDVPRQ